MTFYSAAGGAGPQGENLGDADVALSTALLQKRAELRRGAFNNPQTTAEILNRRRHAREVTQRLRRKYKINRRLPRVARELLAARYKANPLLEAFFPDRPTTWRTIPRRDPEKHNLSLDIQEFSFIDDPVGTMQVISKLVELEATCVSAHVNFTFPYCRDIGPFLVLAELMPGFTPILSGGQITGAVQKVIEAVGLRRALRMEFLSPNNSRDVWAMPVQRRRGPGMSKSDTRFLEPQSYEFVCDMFCDQINEWLLSAGTECELTDDARGRLKTVIGEILDNAERHSAPGGDGTWTVAAFMARRVIDGVETYACHMAFVSLGATFEEGLQNAAGALVEKLNAYVADQKSRLRASQSRETLITLAALQDGVTRDPKAYQEERGGTGLLEVADLVNALAASDKEIENARITIISGRSCIRLAKPYIMGRSEEPNAPRTLWCNATNSSMEQPDEAHVFDLPVKLPGTVISVAFNLDPEFLRSVVEDDE